jgi:hypothetical protein
MNGHLHLQVRTELTWTTLGILNKKEEGKSISQVAGQRGGKKCRKRKDKPDRRSDPGLPESSKGALSLRYPASSWRNDQL